MVSHTKMGIGFGVIIALLLAACTAQARDITGMCYTATNDALYQWMDISATGTTAIGGDSNSWSTTTIPVGFDFEFYGQSFDQINVGVQGAASFDNNYIPDASSSYEKLFPGGGEGMLGNPTVIAPYWDDLKTTATSNNGVYYATYGVIGQRTMTIQWQDVERSDGAGKATFQMILHEGTNNIEFQYKDVTFETDPLASNGLKAEVGVGGNPGMPSWLRWSHDRNMIADQSAVVYSPKLPEEGSISLEVHDCEIYASMMNEVHIEVIPPEPDPPEHYDDWNSYEDSGYDYLNTGCGAFLNPSLDGTSLWAQSDTCMEAALHTVETGSEIHLCFEAQGHTGVLLEGFEDYSGPSTITGWGMADLFADALIEASITVQSDEGRAEGSEAKVVSQWYDEDGIVHNGESIDVVVGTPFDVRFGDSLYSDGDNSYHEAYRVSYAVAPEPSIFIILLSAMLVILGNRQRSIY